MVVAVPLPVVTLRHLHGLSGRTTAVLVVRPVSYLIHFWQKRAEVARKQTCCRASLLSPTYLMIQVARKQTCCRARLLSLTYQIHPRQPAEPVSSSLCRSSIQQTACLVPRGRREPGLPCVSGSATMPTRRFRPSMPCMALMVNIVVSSLMPSDWLIDTYYTVAGPLGKILFM